MITDRKKTEPTIVDIASLDNTKQVVEFNNTKVNFPKEKLLHQLFEEQVLKTPNTIALCHLDNKYSYKELDTRANILAKYLKELGVEPDDRVGICLERNISLVVAVLAVLKSGGAYVPMDPKYPAERIAYMIEDSAPKVLLTQTSLNSLLTNIISTDVPVFDMHTNGLTSSYVSDENLSTDNNNLNSQHLAYVSYTSGSTGKPKGVAVEHRNVVNFVLWASSEFPPIELTKSIFATSLNFDLSVFELFVPLISGGTVRLVNDALAIAQAPADISLINAVPSAVTALLDMRAIPDCVQLMNFGGYSPKRKLVERLFQSTKVERVANLFGPTETTVYSTWVSMTRENGFVSHIGRPIANTQIYILDETGDVAGVGEVGEIHIAGTGVARGYLNRPELTAQTFIPDPFSNEEGGRMYKTGDLGRWLPEGNVEFLGRNDFQVKIRGYRIELGEIEAQLESLDNVKDALVVAREHEAEETQLVAYLIMAGGSANIEVLRESLAEYLPQYMIPSAFVVLDVYPLTPNGKIDRSALPDPDRNASSDSTFVAPKGQIENVIAKIWGKLLLLPQISRFDHFLELGGHSLLAIKLVSRLKQEFSIDLLPSDIFEKPRLDQLAAYVSGSSTVIHKNISRIKRDKPLLMSKEQQRLYFMSQLNPAASVAYHVANKYRLKGELDLTILQLVMNCLIQRHESFRTLFIQKDGSPEQIVQEGKLSFNLYKKDLCHLASQEQNSAIDCVLKEEFLLPFDLKQGPLIRAGVIKLSDTENILFLVQHHIITDGWSNQLLLDELIQLYSAFIKGKSNPLSELTLQYVDYAAWQHQQILQNSTQDSLDFGYKQLKGAPHLLTLPLDYNRPAKQSYRGNQVNFNLGNGLTDELLEFSQQHDLTVFMTLLAGWACLLSRLSGQKDVVIGTPVANRQRVELEPLLGFFANTLALRINVQDDLSIKQLLSRIKNDTLSTIEHQDLPFDQLVEKLNPKRSLSYNPLFQSMFVMENNQNVGGRITSDLEISEEEPPHYTTIFDLSLKLNFDGDRLSGGLEYAEDLFKEQTVLDIAEEYTSVLKYLLKNQKQKVSQILLSNKWTEKLAEKASVDYWIKQLDGAPQLQGVLPDNSRNCQPIHEKNNVATLTSCIKGNNVHKLLPLLEKDELNGTSLMHAAFTLVLSRHSNIQDIVIGVPIINEAFAQKIPDKRQIDNMHVIRTNTGYVGFNDYLSHVQQVYKEAQAQHEISFFEIIKGTNTSFNTDHTPLIQIMFSMEISSQTQLFRNLLLQSQETKIGTKLDLALHATIKENELLLCWEYNDCLYNKETIERLNSHLKCLLLSIATQPNAPIADLQMLSLDEQNFLLQDLTGRQPDYLPEHQLIATHQLFEQQSLLTPLAISLIDESERITYQELEIRANKLARYIQNKGVKVGDLVGICTDRSFNMVVSVLAVLKAGACYVPMDSSYPIKRLEFIINDSQMQLLVSDESCPELSLPNVLNQISLQKESDQIYVQDICKVKLDRALLPDDLCYVVYTSGSTGNPKGVKMPHRVLVNLISTMTSQSERFSEPLLWLQYVSPGFDMCFADIFMSISHGGCLRLIPREVQQDISLLIRLLANESIEALNLPYAVMQLLISRSQELNILLPHLKLVLSAAEQMRITQEIRDFFTQHIGCQLINQYGPSETHVITGHVLTGEPTHWPKLPPIGRLLPNVEGYILDTDKHLTPFGCIGELHVSEFSSSAGYLNLPELTKTSFAISQSVSGKLLYNTGDLVRFCANGELEYFGRRDKQIKIRGFRVELGEIEAKLEACINVNSAVVITCHANNGDISLLAYVILDESSQSTSIQIKQIKQIKQNIQLELPTFMIPNQIITLPHFPLTPNGKIDKAALPLPNEFEIVQTVNTDRELLPDELKLADIWCEVLNINQISPMNEFFELGGHSLLATKLLSRVEDVFGIALGLSTLFETPSLEKMAEKILFESAKEESILMEMLLNDIENLSGEEISKQLEGAFSPTTDLSIKE